MKPNAQTNLSGTEADPATLGIIKHGLPRDSAPTAANENNLEKPNPARERANAGNSDNDNCDPLAIAMNSFTEGLDVAFREAFSANLISGDNTLIMQAQKMATEAMSNMLIGNNIMRMSPEQMTKIQLDMQALCNEIAHEALGLANTPSLQGTKGSTKRSRPVDIQEALREKISARIEKFRFNHCGFAAKVDGENKAGACKKAQ